MKTQHTKQVCQVTVLESNKTSMCKGDNHKFTSHPQIFICLNSFVKGSITNKKLPKKEFFIYLKILMIYFTDKTKKEHFFNINGKTLTVDELHY